MNTRSNETTFQSQQQFICIRNQDVMTAQISDHYPLVHNDVLFWNVMMQGKQRGNGFNNGFGIVEEPKDYRKRLKKIANIIAEICESNKNIKAITICEGPIGEMEDKFYHDLQSHTYISKSFMSQGRFHKPCAKAANWGLLMLANNKYQVNRINYLDKYTVKDKLSELKNRGELFELENKTDHQKKFVALFHLPFGVIDKNVHEQFAIQPAHLSTLGHSSYRLITKLMIRYATEDFTMAGDFNFLPHLLEHNRDDTGFLIPKDNSILLQGTKQQPVTVDGILVSQKNRQKITGSLIIHGLFTLLKREDCLFDTTMNKKNCQSESFKLQ